MKIASAFVYLGRNTYLPALRLAEELLIEAEVPHQPLPVLQLSLPEIRFPVPHDLQWPPLLSLPRRQGLLNRLAVLGLVLLGHGEERVLFEERR